MYCIHQHLFGTKPSYVGTCSDTHDAGRCARTNGGVIFARKRLRLNKNVVPVDTLKKKDNENKKRSTRKKQDNGRGEKKSRQGDDMQNTK